ncbi:MAG: hypothetical protein AAFZ18_11615 [Myxococcota bacterium]
MKTLSTPIIFSALLIAAGLSACDGGGGGTTTPPGTGEGCTPGTTTGCGDGEVCSSTGACVPEDTASGRLVISSSEARACEILLSSTAPIVRATYGAGVEGAFRARPPRFAVAVSQAGNSAFAADAIQLAVEGDPSAVQVMSTTCYGANGVPLAGATASVQ